MTELETELDSAEHDGCHVCAKCCTRFSDVTAYLDHRTLSCCAVEQNSAESDAKKQQQQQQQQQQQNHHHQQQQQQHHQQQQQQQQQNNLFRYDNLTPVGMMTGDEEDQAPDNMADTSCMFLTDANDGADCSDAGDECNDEHMDRDYDVDDSDNDDDDVDQMMDMSSEDPSSAVRLMSFLHPMGVMPFVGRPGGDNNVKLASLGSTDVAVAQFAENNILPSDLAMLNMVLWNLQQQQLFQMHLLQQLQSQLMYASSQACGPPCPMLPTGGFGSLPPGGPPRATSGYPSPPENHHQPNPGSVVDHHLTTSAVAAAAAAAAAAVCSSVEPPIPASATLSNSSAEKTASDSMAGSSFPVGHSTSGFGEKPPASEAGCSSGGLVSSCNSSIPNSSSFISPMLAMIDMSSSKLLQQKILQDSE